MLPSLIAIVNQNITMIDKGASVLQIALKFPNRTVFKNLEYAHAYNLIASTNNVVHVS